MLLRRFIQWKANITSLNLVRFYLKRGGQGGGGGGGVGWLRLEGLRHRPLPDDETPRGASPSFSLTLELTLQFFYLVGVFYRGRGGGRGVHLGDGDVSWHLREPFWPPSLMSGRVGNDRRTFYDFRSALLIRVAVVVFFVVIFVGVVLVSMTKFYRSMMSVD